MKMKFFYAALSIAMLAVGCAKEIAPQDQENTPAENTPVKDGYVRLELSTKGYKPGSKTTLAEGQVNWSTSDKISVFAGSNTTDNYEFSVFNSDGASASFQGEVKEADAVAENFVAAYPYSAELALEGATLSNVVINVEQTLAAGTFASGENPSVAVGGKTGLEFKNLAALIRIPVLGPVKVKSIVLTAPEGVVLAGKGSVDVSAETPALVISESASNVVTMTAETAIDATSGVDFYAVVAPQDPDFTCDIMVVLEDGSSMTQKFEDAEVVRAKARKANDYIDYGTLVYYGTANCYIAKPGETVEIDITPRYMSGYDTCSPTEHDAFTKGVASASVVWKETSLTGELTAVIEDGKLKVGGIAGAGNALVAIKDADGVILWSYHIWVPREDPTEVLTYKMHKDVSDATRQLMPMNLGALDKTGPHSGGCYYQRGRKDPFGRMNIQDKTAIECGINFFDVAQPYALARFWNSQYPEFYGKDAVLWGIQHPTIHLRSGGNFGFLGDSKNTSGFWGCNSNDINHNYAKSVFDPCPAGYKVAPKATFAHFISDPNIVAENKNEFNISATNAKNPDTAANDLGYWFKYDGENYDFYPFAGYRQWDTAGVMNCGTTCSLWYATGPSTQYNYNVSWGVRFLTGASKQFILHHHDNTTTAVNIRCVKE